jgi:peptidoglycan/LPS O-acetylase OafA/YrhL
MEKSSQSLCEPLGRANKSVCLLHGDEPARNVGVDALRAVSTVLVLVLRHSAIPTNTRLDARQRGYYGATLFFAISGFLIMSSATRRYGAALTIPLLALYRFRAARIVPVLLWFTSPNVCLYLKSVVGFELVGNGSTALAELLFYVFTFRPTTMPFREPSQTRYSCHVLWRSKKSSTCYFRSSVL